MDRLSRGAKTAPRRRILTAAILSAALWLASGVWGGGALAHDGDDAVTLTPSKAFTGTATSGNNQGFSFESADLAHGFITRQLLAGPLRGLGPKGVIRISGYTADLVWPAFGAYAETPAPSWAIGGTVDQSDLDSLKQLVDATGWKVSIAVPDSSLVKGQVSADQAIAEVVAAHRTLGDSLQAIEIGNEYNIVTSLTPPQYYTLLKTYYDDITAALPDAHIKVTGPSSTGPVSTVTGFISAMNADTTVGDPRAMLAEITNHHYDAGRCGLDIPGLMSAGTYASRQTGLAANVAAVSALHDGMPFVMNETNSMSGSGCTGVSNSYASTLWTLDYLLQATQAGVARLNFHTSTARACGDYHTDSVGYTTSYRWYAAFCAADQAALDANQLSASPMYYGLWAFRQLPVGQFVELGSAADPSKLRAYGIQSVNNTLTVVLINVQDPAAATSTADPVRIALPHPYYASGSAVTLSSSDPAGFASLDASAITLGGRHAPIDGTPAPATRQTTVPVRHDQAAIDVAPGTAQIVTFHGVHDLPGAVIANAVTTEDAGLFTGGQASTVTVSVHNTTDTARAVTATLAVPAGWQAGSVTDTVPASGQADLAVPVTPSSTPSVATLRPQLSAAGVLTQIDASANVVATPPADATTLALDAGTTTSPVFPGYTGLSPASTWSDGQSFGWVGTPPDSRDRGTPDDLRRDLIASRNPATLRLAVPAGTHEAYLLIGDPGFAADPIVVSIAGQKVAGTTEPLATNTYQWLQVPLDGGTAGQTVDLALASGGASGQYWVLDALVVE